MQRYTKHEISNDKYKKTEFMHSSIAKIMAPSS